MGHGGPEDKAEESEDASVSGLGTWEECSALHAEREIKDREPVVRACLRVSRCKTGCVKIEVLPRGKYI